MTLENALKELKNLQLKRYAYRFAGNMIYYDSVTSAPRGTAEGRGRALELLTEDEFRLFANEKTGELLQFLNENKASLDELTARQVQVLSDEYDKLSRIPAEEYTAYQVLINDAEAVWHEAKKNNDFAAFAPYLERLVDTNRRFAAYYDSAKKPYDALLNEYEKGLDMAACDEYFGLLGEKLSPLIMSVKDMEIPHDFLYRKCDIQRQRVLSDYLMSSLQLNRDYCAIGETEHPFTLNFNNHDVRITTHYFENDFSSSMFSVIHEGGHARYELSCDDRYSYTALEGGVSMGVHESQSRFYENIIGRSYEYLDMVMPEIKKAFNGSFDDITTEMLWRAVNRVEPSLIRTEADEVTYSLHVMIRYMLEKALIAGDIKVKELPGEWNALYKKYLGVDVPDDTRGVLQDSHWSGGAIGYFPSYSIGSAYAAQQLEAMKKDFDPFETIKNEGLGKINSWLAEKIHRHACMYDPKPLMEQVFGGKFRPQCYIDYLTDKVKRVYGI